MHALRKTDPSTARGDTVTHTVTQLSRLSFAKSLQALVFDWVFIAGAISLSLYFKSTWVYLIAIVIIAARQHALLMLVHEGAHFRMAKNHSLNNVLTDLFAAFPIFFCTTAYRRNHLKHHRFLNSMEDPDWARKVSIPEWTFPQTRSQLRNTMFKVMATGWYQMIRLFINFSGVLDKQTYTSTASLKLLSMKIAFYSAALVIIYKFDLGFTVFSYWIVPFLFILPVLERIRSISEHFALSYADDFNQTRDVLCSPVEAFLFGPHNIRYHLSHHLYPSVPQYNLPRLHEKLLQQPDFADLAHQNDAYFWFGKKSVLKDLIQKREHSHE